MGTSRASADGTGTVGKFGAGRCLVACEDIVAGRSPGWFEGVEATALRQLVRVHGLQGLAAKAIHSGTLRVPDNVARGIDQDFAAARGLVARLDQECRRVGEAAVSLNGFRPSPILLKGSAVAHRYDDPTLRTYVDIDLFVPARDIAYWADVLQDLGYSAPKPEIKMSALRYQESVAFTLGQKGLTCDLHACLFIERRARDVTHSEIFAHSQASIFHGLLEATPAAQLIILALHLAHHPSGVWRLIWLRDLIELGDAAVVSGARALAADWDVSWALERALFAAERLLGHPQWDAQQLSAEHFGLEQVHQLDRTHYLRHLAIVYELGPLAGLRYLSSRVDPRRFAPPGFGIDWAMARHWLITTTRRARMTPWSQLSPKRKRQWPESHKSSRRLGPKLGKSDD